MSIEFAQRGNFSSITNFLERAKEVIHVGELDKYGREGVRLLRDNTPSETGITADSWYYKIENKDGIAKIGFYNSNIQNGVPIAIILQYGHATGNGGWVEGIDYINPAMRPLFNKIAETAWKEVVN